MAREGHQGSLEMKGPQKGKTFSPELLKQEQILGSGVVVHTFIPALRRQGQVDPSSRPARDYFVFYSNPPRQIFVFILHKKGLSR